MTTTSKSLAFIKNYYVFRRQTPPFKPDNWPCNFRARRSRAWAVFMRPVGEPCAVSSRQTKEIRKRETFRNWKNNNTDDGHSECFRKLPKFTRRRYVSNVDDNDYGDEGSIIVGRQFPFVIALSEDNFSRVDGYVGGRCDWCSVCMIFDVKGYKHIHPLLPAICTFLIFSCCSSSSISNHAIWTVRLLIASHFPWYYLVGWLTSNFKKPVCQFYNSPGPIALLCIHTVQPSANEFIPCRLPGKLVVRYWHRLAS